MSSAASFSLVVPVFDEEERFGEAAKLLLDFVADGPPGSELIVVDDGSTDGTVEIVERLLGQRPDVPSRLLRSPHLGKGAAVQRGLLAADGDVLAFCDVDLSTPLDDLEQIIQTAGQAPVLAIGSRDVAASRLVRPQSRSRELLGKTYNRLLQLALTPGISDTQCGAKAARWSLWHEVLPHCDQTGFAWDVQVIAVARRVGIPVLEVAVAWSHDDRSRVRVLRDGRRMLTALPRIARGLAAVEAAPDDHRRAGEVFDDHQAEVLLEADASHWWFRCKGSFVADAIRRRRPPQSPDARLIDIGGGAGGVTAIVGWPRDRLVVLDGSPLLAATALRRYGTSAVAGRVDQLPVGAGSFEVALLLDVIEHLEDPVATLREARRILAPEGLLVVNVPAHPRLWSGADEALGHVRRYTRPLLVQHLQDAGFEVTWSSHVFSWLVAPVWLRRRTAVTEQGKLGLDASGPLVDRIALVLARVERSVAARLPLPFGTSILATARPVEDCPPSGPGRARRSGTRS